MAFGTEIFAEDGSLLWKQTDNPFECIDIISIPNGSPTGSKVVSNNGDSIVVIGYHINDSGDMGVWYTLPQVDTWVSGGNVVNWNISYFYGTHVDLHVFRY